MVMSLVFQLARRGLVDPDIWLHLRNAEFLFKTGSLPHFDMYSFTAAGHPWVAHEWGGEVAFYLAWRLGGLVGIKVLSLVLLEAIFGLLVYLCYRRSGNIKAAAVACGLAVLLSTVSFGPRTLLFGYIYMLVLMLILERYRETGSAPLWVIPPMFLVWINSHGSWSMGLIIFGIHIAAGFVEGNWGLIEATAWSRRQLKALVGTFVASSALLFVNPFGYRLVLYPLDMAFHQKLAVSHTAEWVSVDFHDVRGKIVILTIVGLLLCALISDRRWKLHEIGLVIFGLYSGLTYIRFLFFLGIVLAPLAARLLSFLPPYEPEIDKPVLNTLILVCMVAVVVLSFPTRQELEQSIDEQFPTEILPYLKTHPLSGHVLNDYTWGGYLGWNDRNLQVFADSRADIFDYTGVLKDYLDVLSVNHPDRVLDKYNIRYVLFQADQPLSYVLSHDPKWKVDYQGKISVLFERISQSQAQAEAAQ